MTQTLPASSRRASARARGGVARPDAARQPQRRIVGDAQRLLGVGDAHDGQHGAEGLLAHDRHVGRRRRRSASGAKNRPGRSARRAPPVTTRRAARDGVGDLLLGARDLRREGDRADVDVAASRLPSGGAPWRSRAISAAAARRSDRRPASSTSTRSVRMQTWPLCGEAAPDGGARGARQVGVGQHDHRRLAAQLEHRRDQALGRRARPPACPPLAAGEEDHVGRRRSAPRPRRRGPARPGTRPRAGPASRHSSATRSDVSGVCSDGFSTTALPADQRRDAVGVVVEQRPVPGPDDAHHAARVVHDARALVGEDERVAELVGQRAAAGAARVVARQLQRVEELDALRLVAGLAALGRRACRGTSGRRAARARAAAGCAPVRRNGRAPQAGWAARARAMASAAICGSAAGISWISWPVAGFVIRRGSMSCLLLLKAPSCRLQVPRHAAFT